jgi:hypothetical protein
MVILDPDNLPPVPVIAWIYPGILSAFAGVSLIMGITSPTFIQGLCLGVVAGAFVMLDYIETCHVNNLHPWKLLKDAGLM